MRLKRLRRREGGIIDRRSDAASGGGLWAPRGLPIPSIKGGIGIGALIFLIVAVLVVPRIFGEDSPFGSALSPFGDAGSVPQGSAGEQVDPSDPAGQFADAVLDDVQVTWTDVFERAGITYGPTSIVLFRNRTNSGCGPASAATGPFYCPADRLVYLDLGFFNELENRFGAKGDFAEAYVIAHEVGHHVQTLLGINDEVQRLAADDPSRANELSIRLEPQADCFAGVWGRAANGAGALEPGDLEEAIDAAAAVGDDRIQEAVNGRIDPETWTHGSSAQRVQWFRTGFQVGNPDACDTFSGNL